MVQTPKAQTPKAQATTKRIAAEAARLFFEQGYGATTVAEVARAAGVAAGTVMLHFGSKSALATAAFADRIAETVATAAAARTGTSVSADLTSLVAPLYRWYDQHQVVANDLLREALFTDGPWGDYYARTVAQTVVSFAEVVEAHGSLSGADAEVVAEGLLADYLLVLLQGLRGRFESVDAQVDYFLALAQTRLVATDGR